MAKVRSGDIDAVEPDGATLRMSGTRRVLIVGMGKGAGTMLRAVLHRADLVEGRQIAGVLVAPELPEGLPATIEYVPGGHPVPDANSRRAASAILRLLRQEPASDGTLCLFLISGGASAMVELPLDPSIGLEDTAAFHRALVHSRAPIAHINALRKHFSAVKGGRLALEARHLRTLTLLMSDVPAGSLDALGSGPTLPDPSTVADCRRLLHTYRLDEQLPPQVRRFFEDPDLPETPKPEDLERRDLLLLSQADLAEAAAAAATARGYSASIDNTPDDWPAADAAQYLLERFRQLRATHGRVCLVSTGEVLVELPPALQGEALGGRNQHFVLECAARFLPEEAPFSVLSCGSDGVDGNSSAAGGVVGSADFLQADMQRRTQEALATFSSNPLLRRMGSVVETGPTGLNLRDLRIVLG